jgi:cytoskeletal protein CcmA (bactofilin family)
LIVGEHIRIHGTVEGDEDVVVRGRIEGAVRIEGTLTVEPGGWLIADVHARSATVQGTVRGNIHARERIEVARTGRMIGDAVAPEVSIAAGAGFRGRVEMGELPADAAQLAPLETVGSPASPTPSALPSLHSENARTPQAAARPAPDAPRPIPPLARPRPVLRRRVAP